MFSLHFTYVKFSLGDDYLSTHIIVKKKAEKTKTEVEALQKQARGHWVEVLVSHISFSSKLDNHTHHEE